MEAIPSSRTGSTKSGFAVARSLAKACTTLADMRKLGPKAWRSVCPEASIFILGRERAKLGYFWKHAYLKGRSGKHLGLVLNPDTHKPISTNDDFLDVRDFDKKRLHCTKWSKERRMALRCIRPYGKPTAAESSASH